MKKQLHNDKVYTVQEAADAIGISASQMYQVIRIKNDRYKLSVCTEEKAQLSLTSSGIYEVEPGRIQTGSRLEPNCIQTGSNLDTQDRLGKDRFPITPGGNPARKTITKGKQNVISFQHSGKHISQP